MEAKNGVALWSEGISSVHLPCWNELPDIELYLDQVLTLLDKYLSPFVSENGAHIITASMINNYVKLRIIPAPVKKRYSRVQLAYLIVIGLLKQILPIPDVKVLLESQFGDDPDENEFAQAYNRFCALQEKAFGDMAAQAAALENETGRCAALALETAALANASKTLTEFLLHTSFEAETDGCGASQSEPL